MRSVRELAQLFFSAFLGVGVQSVHHSDLHNTIRAHGQAQVTGSLDIGFLHLTGPASDSAL